jgi:hypothetical protein
MRSPIAPGLAGLLAAALLGSAGAADAGVPGVIVNSARTVVHGVHDGALTVARTTRAFVFGGPQAAEDTWHDNVELTREHARRNADRVIAEAGMATEPAHRDDYEHDHAPSRSYPPAPDDDR